MRIRVLGCSGGIGGGRQTTSFLIDDDILLDAGSGVMRLSLEEMAGIANLFVTHAHLDHILALPPLLDSVGVGRAAPLVLHALPEVIDTLKAHLFNWHLWPDFARVPTADKPYLAYAPLAVGAPVPMAGRTITAIPAKHGRPAVGYLLRGQRASLLFSGDTGSHPDLIAIANATDDLEHLIVETSFANDLKHIADVSGHYCPATLLPDLAQLKPGVSVWITHLKPGGEDAIMAELASVALPCGSPRALVPDQVFDL
ncbi:3',5'-cyclic-nucleotide phosphodiesterase [Parasulfuritortus cantonensis]|uniref:3',5'-cyclic-nucleotide phosphodiesterase n=1 Tax=Parasulfuritortus cantonensis TaxID=2528202 RepID=A0A4R1BD92_9PROT|nr:3',5'-cyclic-nucleotide phosphodiesterase [Parasulfuritortus cantonensis]TCJ15041.1 3',5'-cyclic-nucleotide phosphodiesterase [Parasulfuritortus cantonensis]